MLKDKGFIEGVVQSIKSSINPPMVIKTVETYVKIEAIANPYLRKARRAGYRQTASENY